jgi:hypothetical protein
MTKLLRLALATILVFSTLSRQTYAQDVLTVGAVINGAQSVITELKNIGATWGGDFSIATGGTASQLGALLTQFQSMVNNNINVPLNSLGLDVQNLGRRIQAATDQLNQILTHQRNCGFANAEALISGIRNVGLNVTKNVPFVSAGNARVDYIQFAGHDPEVVPREGGRATVFGYQLYPGTSPTVTLWDEAGHSLAALRPERATSDDSFAVNVAGQILATHAGQTLLLDIHTHKKKYFLGFIPSGEDSTELKLPLSVPQAYDLKYRVVAKGVYSCTQTVSGTLPPIGFGFENSSCEDRKNVSDVRTPALPSGAGISNPQITGWHYSAGPNIRNQSNVGVSYTPTTVTAAGWLDTATCIQVGWPVHIAKLDHPTNWGAGVAPEVRYSQALEHDENGGPVLVDASLPTTTATMQLNSSCFEAGPKSFSYKITPILNGKDQKDLYDSPIQTGSEHGVNDAVNLGSLSISGAWNPQPVQGSSQVVVTISAPQCGH